MIVPGAREHVQGDLAGCRELRRYRWHVAVPHAWMVHAKRVGEKLSLFGELLRLTYLVREGLKHHVAEREAAQRMKRPAPTRHRRGEQSAARRDARALRSAGREQCALELAVSYTHLTLPTIYSV